VISSVLRMEPNVTNVTNVTNVINSLIDGLP
jgi:hypothetical protein